MRQLTQEDVFVFLNYLTVNHRELMGWIGSNLEYRDNNRLILEDWPEGFAKSDYEKYKSIHDSWMKDNGIQIIEEDTDFALG